MIMFPDLFLKHNAKSFLENQMREELNSMVQLIIERIFQPKKN